MLKVKEGLTTMEEALGTVPPDMEAYEVDDTAVSADSSE
jgi:hypothetical protein